MVFRKLFSIVSYFLLVPYLVYSQKLPKNIGQHFTNCYDSSYSKTDKPFETEGYYIFRELNKKCSACLIDTFEFITIFYKDGTYVDNALGHGNMSFEAYAEYLKMNKDAEKLKWLGKWGIYKIEGDEIVAQSIFNPGFRLQLYKWDICETRYKIIDGITSKIISRQC